MKQSLAIARFLTLFIVLSSAFVFWITACGRLPRSHSPVAESGESPVSASKPATINLNHATAAELERLPGIGPVLAERIIAYRKENGHFRRAEHLMMVRGISDRKFRELRPLVKVE